MHIGLKAKAPAEGVVELLLECHGRIRSFLDLAARIGSVEGLGVEEIGEAAGRVRRYFVEALPLHVEDEEESLLPRLKGHDADLDVALGQMHHEHHEHLAAIERLVSLCVELETTPAKLGELRGELAAAAAELSAGLGAHLAHEEERILPAIARWIGPEEQAAMVMELRARRASSEAQRLTRR